MKLLLSRTFLASWFAFTMATSAFAHPKDTDLIDAIPEGTRFVAKKDINILPNRELMRLGEKVMIDLDPRADYKYYIKVTILAGLIVSPATVDRFWRGFSALVSGAIKYSSDYSFSISPVVDKKEIKGIYCFKSFYRVIDSTSWRELCSIGELKNVLDSKVSIELPAPREATE